MTDQTAYCDPDVAGIVRSWMAVSET